MQRHRHLVFIAFALSISILAGLACSLTGQTSVEAPALDATKVVLEFQATAMARQLTDTAGAAPAAAALAPTQGAAPTAVPQTSTPDVEALIRGANVLVYENVDERGIGMWIQEALNGLGIQYTQTGSYSGRFMEYLNSSTEYDLIIVGAEDKDRISGEFWDVINSRLVRDKAALIAELWYLDREAAGPISQILAGCGIRYQKDYQVAESVYWWVPEHPVFNEPNSGVSLIHYNRFWANQTGDQIRLGGGGQATLLAGLAANPSGQEAVLASCYDGRVIIQTFSTHDYNRADMVPLWQNYIHFTLTNHFAALE